MEMLKIMLVDDDVNFTEELSESLQIDNKNEVVVSNDPKKALDLIKTSEIDIAILDINMPNINGLELLSEIKKVDDDIEVIMITGQGDMDSVVTAMRNGAIDYFTKPFKQVELQAAIERTRKYKELQYSYQKVKQQYNTLTNEINNRIGINFIGNSKKTLHIVGLMDKVAHADDTSVLITGESGTGKELVARGIHFLSERKNNYFHSVNCSAIPESLFESEFFGHSKGAFTGANANKTGWFEISNHGTLFLDEIGDMRLDLQAKFLRVLDEKIITRVGSHKRIDLDVRIIAATNQDLEKLVSENKFRKDLFHRLNSFNIFIPPLRERIEDIPEITKHYVFHYASKLKKPINSIDVKVFDYLKQLPFNGNVRELKNLIERAVIMCDSKTFTLASFNGFAKNKNRKKDTYPEILNLQDLEKNAISKALLLSEGNKSTASKFLNISRQALDRKIKKYSL